MLYACFSPLFTCSLWASHNQSYSERCSTLGSQSHHNSLLCTGKMCQGHHTSGLGSRLGAKPEVRQRPLFTWLLTDLSRTVGTKSCPMPSTSMVVVSVLFISLGRATMEPSGSTPTIFEGGTFCQTKMGVQKQPNTKLKGKVTHTLISVFLPITFINIPNHWRHGELPG